MPTGATSPHISCCGGRKRLFPNRSIQHASPLYALCAAATLALSALAVTSPGHRLLPPDPLGWHRHLPGLGREHSDKAVPSNYKMVSKPVPTLAAALAVKDWHVEEGQVQHLRLLFNWGRRTMASSALSAAGWISASRAAASSRNACALPPASGCAVLAARLKRGEFRWRQGSVRRQSKQLAAAFVPASALHLTTALCRTAAWSACAKPPGRCRAAASRSPRRCGPRHLADALRRLGMAASMPAATVDLSRSPRSRRQACSLAPVPGASADQHRFNGKLQSFSA